jgi:hypothetical protein
MQQHHSRPVTADTHMQGRSVRLNILRG